MITTSWHAAFASACYTIVGNTASKHAHIPEMQLGGPEVPGVAQLPSLCQGEPKQAQGCVKSETDAQSNGGIPQGGLPGEDVVKSRKNGFSVDSNKTHPLPHRTTRRPW
jgi:hypothetical protein